jgi:hypothetical protein
VIFSSLKGGAFYRLSNNIGPSRPGGGGRLGNKAEMTPLLKRNARTGMNGGADIRSKFRRSLVRIAD